MSERISLRVEFLERELAQIKDQLRSKPDKEDLERIEDKLEKLATQEGLNSLRNELNLNMTHNKQSVDTDMNVVKASLNTKVGIQEFHPVKVIFGTTVTIFSGYLLTQLARIFFGGV